MKLQSLTAAVVAAAAATILVLPGCLDDAQSQAREDGNLDDTWPAFDECISVVNGTKGNEGIHGVVTFKQEDGGVKVHAEITGLAPDSVHAIHIHEFGDVDCDFGKCTGGHFNPTNKKHGGPDSAERHAGDMGNLKADASGRAVYEYVDKVIQLRGKASILGRGVTLHAGVDDFKTQPTGAAGTRIGTGVIGIAEVKKSK